MGDTVRRHLVQPLHAMMMMMMMTIKTLVLVTVVISGSKQQ